MTEPRYFGDLDGAVCCRECKNFERDTVGFGYGAGKCRPFEALLAKNPGEKAVRRALNSLGNPDYQPFWGGPVRDRFCNKYQPLILPDNSREAGDTTVTITKNKSLYA